MNPKQQQDLFKRYLNGTTSPEETAWVEKWYAAFDSSDTNTPEERFSSRAGEQMLSGIFKQIRKTRVIQLWQQVGRVAAAVLVIGLGIWGLFRDTYESPVPQYSYISSERGKRLKVLLPDSSTVWLNENTTLKYTQRNFGKEVREVWLEKGEAFFEVKRNEQVQFVVHTGPVTTRVLGTAFNIRKSNQLHDIQVSVTQGRVQVHGPEKVMGILAKGEELNYDLESGAIALRAVNPAYTAAWKLGRLEVVDASFEELSAAFYSLYNIRLTSGSAKLQSLSYTLTLDRRQTPEAAAAIIAAVHGLSHRNENGALVIY